MMKGTTRGGAMALVVDPVCGMNIDSVDAAGTVDHEGKTYFFCSEACREAFQADPGPYLD